MRRLLFCLLLAACAGPADAVRESAAAQEAPRCTEDRWSWRKLGVVRGLPDDAASGDGMLAPAVLEREGVLHLWYTQKVGTRQALMHSQSPDDGETFSTPEVLLGLGESSAYPTVWWEQGNYNLLFGGGSVRHATSPDGVHFALASGTALGASFEQGRFDAVSVLYPSRTSDGVLFFSGYDGQHLRIGRAAPHADGRYGADPVEPVIDLGAANDFDNAAVAQAHVQRAFGRWWMWYGGYDTSQSNPGPYRIGSASSDDGIAWNKHGVAIALSAAGTDAWSTRDPAVIVRADHSMMFYVGLGDDGRYRLHRAVSDAAGCAR